MVRAEAMAQGHLSRIRECSNSLNGLAPALLASCTTVDYLEGNTSKRRELTSNVMVYEICRKVQIMAAGNSMHIGHMTFV